ncbi:hypothetical protein STXM2123_3522 [Streptomyces sp. F-3]|nr:hypothetical protein STXM2123_3522 [Streptomyces sp. F-3]
MRRLGRLRAPRAGGGDPSVLSASRLRVFGSPPPARPSAPPRPARGDGGRGWARTPGWGFGAASS